MHWGCGIFGCSPYFTHFYFFAHIFFPFPPHLLFFSVDLYGDTLSGCLLRDIIGNAMHAVRTQCEVLDVSKYSNPSFGPFSQVFGSVPGFFWLPKHLGCGIFELSTISP